MGRMKKLLEGAATEVDSLKPGDGLKGGLEPVVAEDSEPTTTTDSEPTTETATPVADAMPVADTTPTTTEPTCPDLSAGLSDDDKVIYRQGFDAFLACSGPDLNPYAPVATDETAGETEPADDDPAINPDPHKSTIWLAGYTGCGLKEGFDAAKQGAEIGDCEYYEAIEEEIAAGEYDFAGVWLQGWKAFHESAKLSGTVVVEGDVAALETTTTTDTTTTTPIIPAAATNGTPPYDPVDWLQRIQAQNELVIKTEIDFEGAKSTAKALKTAHESELKKLSELINDQKKALDAWNRPLPLFDAFGRTNSNGGNSNGSIESNGHAENIVAPAPTPITPTIVDTDNAWRLANISELNLPGKLAEKLKEDAGVQTVGELEDLRGGKGLDSIKGIGPSKITIIEDAVVSWLSVQRDAKALAAASVTNHVAGPAPGSDHESELVSVAVDATADDDDDDLDGLDDDDINDDIDI